MRTKTSRPPGLGVIFGTGAHAGSTWDAQADCAGRWSPRKNPRRGKFGNVPDMTPEEHQQRGDAAEALFRELTHRVREA